MYCYFCTKTVYSNCTQCINFNSNIYVLNLLLQINKLKLQSVHLDKNSGVTHVKNTV